MSNGESKELNKTKRIDILLEDVLIYITENNKKIKGINDFLFTGLIEAKADEGAKLSPSQGWFDMTTQKLEIVLAINTEMKSELEKLSKEVK